MRLDDRIPLWRVAVSTEASVAYHNFPTVKEAVDYATRRASCSHGLGAYNLRVEIAVQRLGRRAMGWEYGWRRSVQTLMSWGCIRVKAFRDQPAEVRPIRSEFLQWRLAAS